LINIIFIVWFINIIIVILGFLSVYLGKKNNKDREKFNPFECGLDPFSSSRISFSGRFFLIAILFLVFDVEIALLLPLLVLPERGENVLYLLLALRFLIILVIGIVFEYKRGSLDWKI